MQGKIFYVVCAMQKTIFQKSTTFCMEHFTWQNFFLALVGGTWPFFSLFCAYFSFLYFWILLWLFLKILDVWHLSLKKRFYRKITLLYILSSSKLLISGGKAIKIATNLYHLTYYNCPKCSQHTLYQWRILHYHLKRF